MGNTKYQLHDGIRYDDGIYMSDEFGVSLGYSHSFQNFYANSCLPNKLLVLSLVENAALPCLSKPVAQNEFTQKDESACITRVLFLIENGNEVCEKKFHMK